MNNTVNVFIALLRNAITGFNENIYLSNLNYDELFSLAKFHDLAHIVYYELTKMLDSREGENSKKFKSQFDNAVYRHLMRDIAISQIREGFEDGKIPFILLKGVHLMDLYPEQWMRTSSDVDVLVHEDDLARAEKVLKRFGMERDHEGPYDVSYFTQNHYHVELHYSSVEDYVSTKHKDIMLNVWSNSEIRPNCNYERLLHDEFFYFYHVAHMAKHFRNGGNGVRTIIDTWLLNHRKPFDQEKRSELLKQGDLVSFDNQAKKLAEAWFSNGERDSFLNEFEDYIIHGGTYGTAERMAAITKRQVNNRAKYYFSRILPPYCVMKRIYPVLKNNSILLPTFWIIRWFRLINPEVRENAKKEIKYESRANEAVAIRMENLMKQLDIWHN